MQCIDDIAGFRALRNDWQVLFQSCPNMTPFNSWEWLFSWWQAYRGARQLRLLTWRTNRVLVGIAPLCLTSEKTNLGIECQVLRFVGDGSSDSDYLGCLIHPGAFTAVVQRLGEWLQASREWDALALRELPESSAWPEAVRNQADRFRFQFRVEYGQCGAVELPVSFEDFLQSRQSRFRTKLRSLLKKLDESSDLAFELSCEPGHLRGRLRSLFALHQKRWQDVGAPGVFGTASKRLFYAHFVPRFARRDWLRLYSLRKGVHYVAHQLCFAFDGITYLLQEGFDVSDKSASYGQMLRAAIMRELIQRGERRYDFLGGFSRHKDDWGATEGKTVHLVVARRQWRGSLYYSLPLWRERLVSEAKRVLPDAVVRGLKQIRTTNS